jgi:hypothetical protein
MSLWKEEKVSFYKIRVKGHLDERWSDWFDGLEITNLMGGEVVLSGEIVDQAALHGMLAKVRDLGLPLIAVTGDGQNHQEPALRPEQNQLSGRNYDVLGG